MDPSTLLALLLSCAPLVAPSTARALVAAESSLNPHAIGVVGGMLERQPRNRREALATAEALRDAGWNFSVGLAQINVRNLPRLQLSLDSAFEPCCNLSAMQAVLSECFERAAGAAPRAAASEQHALRQALSCYYSGNFITGFEHGYVRRIAQLARDQR
jgi:type IV secretion system protein VirB1